MDWRIATDTSGIQKITGSVLRTPRSDRVGPERVRTEWVRAEWVRAETRRSARVRSERAAAEPQLGGIGEPVEITVDQ